MNAQHTPRPILAADWPAPEQLQSLLTLAITQVRSAEVAPEVLAKTIMVAIQTEVARSRAEVYRCLTAALQGEHS